MWSQRLTWSRRTGAALAATLALAAGAAHGQVENDTCEAAAPLASGVPTAGTTVGAALDQDFSWLCERADAADVYYVFVTPAAGPYEFTATGANNGELSLTLTSGCDFPMGIHGCAVGTGGPGGSGPRLEYLSGFAGETIIVRVGTAGAGQGFTVTGGPLPPPANDECSGATPLTLDVPVSTHNISATTSVELPMAALCSSIAPGIAGGADVFFSFTPPADGFYDFSACDSVFDSVISVHSGCPATEANAIACNDNGPLSACDMPFGAYVSGVELAAGVTYYVRVASVLPWDEWNGLGEPGRGPFTVVVRNGQPAAPPPNDECANAVAISPDELFASGTTAHASLGEQGPCGADDVFDVWFTWTGNLPGVNAYEFLLPPGTFNGAGTLAAYTACGGQLISCHAPTLVDPQMRLVVTADQGETVVIRVAGQQGMQGAFDLYVSPLGQAPANTTCATATPLSAGEPMPVSTFNAATSEETPCGSGLADIYPLWYTFTAPEAGWYRIATELPAGSQALTTVALYDGCGGEALTCSYRGDRLSENPAAAATTYELAAGQTVAIRVSMAYGETGSFTLTAEGPLPPPPPVTNDLCEDAIAIGSMPFEDEVNVTLATPDQDVCEAQGMPLVPTPGGIWYRYTPEVDRVLRASAAADDPLGAVVAVFTGECGALEQIGCPESLFGPPPRFRLTAGTEYHILAALSPARNGDEGSLAIPYGTHLSVSLTAPAVPANDTCAGAERIGESSVTFRTDTTAANHDAPAPSCAGMDGMLSDGVWYRFTTQTAGTLTVVGEGNPDGPFFYSPAGALFSGSCGALTEVVCDNPADGFFLTNRFTLQTQLAAGETYYLLVGSWAEPVGGEIEVTFSYTGDIAPACPADWSGDGEVNSTDISAFLTAWLDSLNNQTLDADFNGDNTVNSSDISAFLTAWLQAVQGNC